MNTVRVIRFNDSTLPLPGGTSSALRATRITPIGQGDSVMNDDTILTANDGSGDTITAGELRRYVHRWTIVLCVSAAISIVSATIALLIATH